MPVVPTWPRDFSASDARSSWPQVVRASTNSDFAGSPSLRLSTSQAAHRILIPEARASPRERKQRRKRSLSPHRSARGLRLVSSACFFQAWIIHRPARGQKKALRENSSWPSFVIGPAQLPFGPASELIHEIVCPVKKRTKLYDIA